MNSLLFRLRRRLSLTVFALLYGFTFSANVVAQEATPEAEATTAEAPEAGAEGGAPRAAADITLEEAQAAAEEGQQAIAAKEFDKAFAAYTTLLQYGSVNPFERALAVLMGYTGRGQALAGMEEYEAALEEFRLALEQNENFTPALIARGHEHAGPVRTGQIVRIAGLRAAGH
jgi:tetratricopeptide (TPR) repeat protein